MHSRQQLKHDASIFLLIACTLITVGIIFVYSSSSFYAIEHYNSAFYFVKKQLLGLLVGAFLFHLAYHIPLQILKQISFFILLLALGFSALPLLEPLSITMHGSSRWLNLFGFGFQPSELLKVALVIYIASFLSRKEDQLKSFVKGYIPLMLILSFAGLILLLQPDFGCFVTLVLTTLVMMFIGNVNMKYLFMTGISTLPLGALLIFMQPYRLKRIFIYLNPWEDAKGAGFQIIQSLIAVGSGGLFGLGIGQSKQKFLYLPMQHTDFIFAIIAEETGFVGASLLVFLYMMLVYIGFKISWQLKDTFSIFLVQGSITLLTIQTIINIMVTVGLVPTKGIGLPFISYGNTALACQILLVGLIANACNDFYE
ncbi:putative lipid II flippase FtsW [bacterium]|jgi:cell division protein FtsW|nr:putative lipid II flippase FtsW [bacterium]